MHSYDLAIAYRVYPKVAKPAVGLPFSEDKLRLSEICLRSFKESLGDLRVKLWALLDGCTAEYAALFQKYFDGGDLVLVPLPGVGNQATFGKQIDILLQQEESDLIYFAEDDYFYLPDQIPLMARFLCEGDGVDFVTPYDHPDCYALELHREPRWVTVFGEHHWRTAASTCLTFLTRKDALAKYERTLRTYSRTNGDCAMWLSLTKRRVFSPLTFMGFFLRREFYWREIVKAWLFCWRQIVFGKAAKLWAPVPGFATHLATGLLSPCVDWVALMRAKEVEVGCGMDVTGVLRGSFNSPSQL